MTTVSIHMEEQSGQSGLSLYLRKTSDGTLLNAGGDALTESPASSGRFTATVAEAWTELLSASVLNGSSLVVRTGWVSNGETIVRDAYPSATPADVNAQVLDVLQTDTFGELSAPPAATSSLKDKIVWTFMWLRNKATQTATQRKLYADDGTTVVSTEAVTDDGTTYTKGEQA